MAGQDLSRPLDDLEASLRQRERRAFVRTAVVTLIPVVAAAVLLWVTVDRVREAEQRLDDVTRELAEARRGRDAAREEVRRLRAQLQRDQARLKSVQADLRSAQQRLRRSSNFVRRLHPVDFRDVKLLSSRSIEAARLFTLVEELRHVPWGFADTPERGFVSPGFAGFVLQRLGRLPRNEPPRSALFRLERSPGPPFVGDVVLYDAGFAMFHLRDAENRPFVIGMTPVGVLSLEPDFGPRRLFVLRTGLSDER